MTANQVIHSVKKSGQHSLVMKVDFHKAFNSVVQGYLEKVMSYMGF
jgi:hypothetical protein